MAQAGKNRAHEDNRLIQRLRDAMVAEHPWSDLLVALNARFHGTWSVLIRQDCDSGAAKIDAAAGLSNADQRAYERYYGPRSPVFFSSIGFPLDRAYTERACADHDAYLRSEIHNDFFRPRHGDHLMSVNLSRAGREMIYFACRRSANAGEFNDEEITALGRLSPHLRRLLAVQAIRAEAGAALFYLDGEGRLLEADAAGAALLARADGLYLDEGRVRAPARRGGVVAHGERAQASVPILAAVPLPDGFSTGSGARPAILLAAAPGDIRHRLDPGITARVFGLTRAEGRLVSTLVSRGSLAGAAEALGITANTARTHMKRVLSKTGCANQVDLVAEVMARAALLVRRD